MISAEACFANRGKRVNLQAPKIGVLVLRAINATVIVLLACLPGFSALGARCQVASQDPQRDFHELKAPRFERDEAGWVEFELRVGSSSTRTIQNKGYMVALLTNSPDLGYRMYRGFIYHFTSWGISTSGQNMAEQIVVLTSRPPDLVGQDRYGLERPEWKIAPANGTKTLIPVRNILAAKYYWHAEDFF